MGVTGWRVPPSGSMLTLLCPFIHRMCVPLYIELSFKCLLCLLVPGGGDPPISLHSLPPVGFSDTLSPAMVTLSAFRVLKYIL